MRRARCRTSLRPIRFPNAQFGFNGDGTLFTLGNPGFEINQVDGASTISGAMRDPVFFNPYKYTYNFAPDNALQLPLERTSAFARAEFELSDSVRIYAQGLYSDYSVTRQLAATPLREVFHASQQSVCPRRPRAAARVTTADPTEAVMLFKRVSETGPRTGTHEYDVYQVTVGVAGDVVDDWQYEVYAQIGANDQVDRQTGNLLTSRIEELTFAPDGGVSVCGGFNPFGSGSISAECMEYISIDASNHAEVDQTIAEASLSGPLMGLPAGDLKAAFGVVYKEDKYQYTASPEASVVLEPTDIVPFPRQDMQGFNASDGIKGDDHNFDVYAELLVPVLRDRPGVQSLETVVGYRLSDYASAGSFDSWKAELIYQPVDAVRLRGSYQQAVRAPSVYELYLPPAAGLRRFPLVPARGGSMCRRQPGKDRVGCCPDRSLVPGAGHTGVDTARFRWARPS